MNKVVGILGYGEVGQAIGEISRKVGYTVLTRDLKLDQLKEKHVDILHICIREGQNADFLKIVIKAVKELKPSLVIINSSVTPGTTRKIFSKTGVPTVHSPVIGIHPRLKDSIKKHFTRMVGPVDRQSERLASKHYKKLGLKFEIFDRAEETEAGKLLELIYYAWNIVFCKWVDEVCDDLGLNFNQVYTRYNEIYNSGYKKIVPRVVRPVLLPIKGPIGGHCAIPNTILFNNFKKSPVTQFILKENRRYKRQAPAPVKSGLALRKLSSDRI